MTQHWPSSLILAGAGKMGSALMRGWLAKGLPPKAIHVVDPNLDAETTGFCIGAGVDLAPPRGPAQVLVLAVKPQVFDATPLDFGRLAGPETLIVSILAGKTIAKLRARLPNAAAIVRAMPNLPAAIGQGATGCAAEAELTDAQRQIAQTLLQAVGRVAWLDESLMDAVTAVSGSGPAYVFLLTECLADAGVAAGLPADIAAQLARQTVEGAAALMTAEPGKSAASLREAVTSPGGTTEAALAVLRDTDALAALMTKAVSAAAKRASELAG